MTTWKDGKGVAFVRPSTLGMSLILGGILLLLAHLLHYYVTSVSGISLRIFDLDVERNIPTLYSAALWGLASYFAYGLARAHAGDLRFLWKVFCGVCAFLAVDEYGTIHDSLNAPLRNAFGFSGVFHFPWVIPYAVLLLVIAPFGWRLLRSLPLRYNAGFVVSGCLYVFGAFVMEMVGAGLADQYGQSDFSFFVSATIEESFEIAGVSLFVYFMYEYIWRKFPSFRWKTGSALRLCKVMLVLALLLCAWDAAGI